MTTRVLHIIPSLAQGSAEEQLRLLAAHLPRRDVDVHVCTMAQGGLHVRKLRLPDTRVNGIGNARRSGPLDYFSLRNLIRCLQPDIVQTWGGAANTLGNLLASSAGVKRRIATDAFHGHAPPWYRAVANRYMVRSTGRIVVPNETAREHLVSQGFPREKLVVIPRAVLPAGSDALSSRERLLKELQLPQESRLIGTVARLAPWNRVKDLIWSTDLLNIVRDDVHLLIIGEGTNRWRLERFRDNVRIGHRVHFLGRRDDLSYLIPPLDCFWLSSDRENQSSEMMQAMAAGVPVVATDVPANRGLIRSGQTGYLFPVGNRGILARRTYQLFEDGEMSRRVGAAGRQRVLKEFNVENMIHRYLTLYDDVMRESP